MQQLRSQPLHVRRLALLGWAALALATGACAEDSPGGPSGPAVQVATIVPRWSLFEATLDQAVTAANPFDPDEVAVSGEFEGPSGTVIVDGFVSRDYTRSQGDTGAETLMPSGDLHWKIRFTPTVEGGWRWRWHLQTHIAGAPPTETLGDWKSLEVTAPAAGAHGFVRRSATAPRQLVHDDGTPVFYVGENVAWYDARGTYAYDAWLAKLAAAGCNFIRIWMPSWAFGLEWTRRAPDGSVAQSSLGDYTTRLDRAWQLDYVLESARRHGIEVMLSIQNHGAFSQTANPEWDDNPYNAANGGPLARPRDFFTDPEARRLFERRLRYIVARWGHAPNVMTWELWNEVDLVDQPTMEALTEWHTTMAAALHRFDPNDHLVSTSASVVDALFDESPLAPLWQLDAIDFVQGHYYSIAGGSVDFRTALPALAQRLGTYGKPVLITEAGVDMVGPAETLAADPDAEGFHDILWATIFAETFGTGMAWWWDNVVDPEDLYGAFAPVAQFVAGVDFAAEGFVDGGAEASVTPGDARAVSANVRQGERTVLAWVTNDAHLWNHPDTATVTGATLHLGGLAAGAWTPTWFDTRTGATTVGGAVTPASGNLDLAVPPFARDLALRLARAGAAPAAPGP